MIQQPDSLPFRDLPTTSLYLRDSLHSAGLCPEWDKYRTGPSSFRFDDRLVIIRYATDKEVGLARTISASGGQVIYLIDDDLAAIVDDPNLPEDYRVRIEAFVSGPWQALQDLIDEVVVASSSLSKKMGRRGFENVTQLDPFWSIPAEEVSEDLNQGRPLEIAWLGSRSHTVDLESISAELAKFLSQHNNVRLTVLFGKNKPKWLKKLRQVENIKPLAWPDYQEWINSRQYDLALYPLVDTEVNQSRSINKFLEHAVVGAASIISTNAPFADRLQPEDCLFAEPGEWIDCLELLLADRKRMLDIANQARKHAQVISEKARTRQVEFWKERLPVIKNDRHTSEVQI